MANDNEPHWQQRDSKVLYSGRVKLVEHDVALPDGSLNRYEVDESVPFAVATLVVDGTQVILARQYRYPIDRWVYDLPGGAGDADETPEDAARRELEEELGLVATTLRPLATFFTNPGRTSWPVHLFICHDATPSGTKDTSDPSEQVNQARMTFSELDAAIASSEIVDPALIIARATGAARGLLPPLTA